jgi:UDP-N-acetylglucosamine--N-acetylmuramyl-(pentapeptide) pyrophosphoryl-undecaprenol N-acetylglucosamine transferase
MKILFTGGGSGGHFYPIIAVAEQIERIVNNEKLLQPSFYYMAPEAQDDRMLYDHGIEFIEIPAGKMRIYFSIKNFSDILKTVAGSFKAFFKMFSIFPDVVFGKGGFGSFPALMAARMLRIPVIIHESDSSPGRVNKWAGKFADRVAVSYPEAAAYFPKERVAWTGQPVRTGILSRTREEAEKFLKLEPNVPVMLVLGGSLGAERINEVIISSLNELLPNWQIIHQTGRANLKDVSSRANVIVADKSLLGRYHPFDFMTDSALAMASGAASLVVSRAGSSIFEIASWGLPSIIIPISESNGDHQRQNAFNYAKSGAAITIEEANLAPHIFITEVENIRTNDGLKKTMIVAAKAFSRPDAAEKIARALINVCLSHGGK